MLNGSISKRKDGRIEYQITIGKDRDGKRIRKSFYGKSEREVKIKAKEWFKNNDINQTLSKTISFSEWADRWLEVYKKNTVRAYTYENTYRRRVEKYLKPYFSQRPLDAITQIDIQAFFNSQQQLSMALQKTLKVILHDMFNRAVDNDFCQKNPVSNIKLQSTHQKVEKRVLNETQQLKAIQWSIQNKRFDILTVLKTGIRRGELLGLRWEDVDLEHQIITISQSISPPVAKGKDIDYKLKSESSHRSIPIDEELTNCLKQIQQKSGLVFGCDNANVYGKHIKKVLEQMANDCNIPYLTLHELRHTMGTVLREKGVDLYSISKVLGHSGVDVTASIYVHNDIEVLRKALKMTVNDSQNVEECSI